MWISPLVSPALTLVLIFMNVFPFFLIAASVAAYPYRRKGNVKLLAG